MAVDKQQVKELLGSGLSVTVVSSAVGCSESYVTQLLSDEEFAADVSRLRVLSLQAYSRRDLSLDAIEDRLIAKLDAAVNEGAFYKPHDILHALRTVNGAKRRGVVSSDASAIQNNTVINLTIPSSIARKFTISPQGEVIQVDDQTLVTMPTGQLLRQFGETTGEPGKYAALRAKLMIGRDRTDSQFNERVEENK